MNTFALNLDEKATSRLGFEPIKDANGELMFEGTIPATITSIEKVYTKYEKGEFANLEVPALKIEFRNVKLREGDPDRFTELRIKPVGTKQKSEFDETVLGPRPEKDINNNINDEWKMIKHILDDICKGSPNYRNILSTPKDVQTSVFALKNTGSAEEIVKSWDVFFDYIVSFINGDGEKTKSQLVDANGKALEIFVKVLPNYDTDPKRNRKWYSIPNRVGNGVFELLKRQDKNILSPRIIKVKATENIELGGTTPNPSFTPNVPSGAAQAAKNAVDDLLR